MPSWIEWLFGWGPIPAGLAGVKVQSSGRAIRAAQFGPDRLPIGVGIPMVRRKASLWERATLEAARFIGKAGRFAGAVARSIGRAIAGTLSVGAAMVGAIVRTSTITRSAAVSGHAAPPPKPKFRPFVVAKSNVRPFVVTDQHGVLPRPKKVFRVK